MTEGISIIIPAYNEERGISSVIEQLLVIMKSLEMPCELIVVDDGSVDQTAERVGAFADVSLIQHQINRGYGAALKTGIRHAHYDLICISDADGTYPNDQIPPMLASFHEKMLDMIVGARVGTGVKIPLIRRPAKWFIRKLAEIVAGSQIPDINSGLRIFRKPIAFRFFNILPDGFSFTTTITLGMLTNAYSVGYHPISYHQRVGKSKIKPIRDTLNFIVLIFRMALYFEPLKIFLPLSLFLLVLGAGWGLFTAIVWDSLADNSMFLIGLTALQVGMLGLIAELINRRVENPFKE